MVTGITNDRVMAQVEIRVGPLPIVSQMGSEARDDLALEVDCVAVAVLTSTTSSWKLHLTGESAGRDSVAMAPHRHRRVRWRHTPAPEPTRGRRFVVFVEAVPRDDSDLPGRLHATRT
jgi:hypothetical protein